MNENCNPWNNCHILDLFNSLWKRWSLHILFYLSFWSKWFNELKRNIPQISSKVLSQRLLELEQDWFIIKNILSEKPFRVEYILTQKTKNLKEIFEKNNYL